MPSRARSLRYYRMPDDTHSLAYQIRKRRAEKGWSQIELAQRATDALGEGNGEITQSQISSYERGAVKAPALETLRALDDAFGLEPGTLLRFSEWPGAANRVRESPPPGSIVIPRPTPNMTDLVAAVVLLPDDELPRLIRSARFWVDRQGAGSPESVAEGAEAALVP